jgi:predicted MFS family arabinose efflux permease
MKDLNEKQLDAIEKMAINAGTVFLGTLILGGFFASRGFQLTPFIAGVILYVVLIWLVLKINEERKS